MHWSSQSCRFSAHLLSITHHQTEEQFVHHTCTSTHVCTVHTHAHTHGWINLAALHTELLCTHSQRCYRSQNVEIFLHMSGAPGRAACLLPREAWLGVRAPPATLVPPEHTWQPEMHVCGVFRILCVFSNERPSFIPDWDAGSSSSVEVEVEVVVEFALQCGVHKDGGTTFPPRFPHEYQRRRRQRHNT